MRIDVISIFPEYLAPLGLSLPGKARAGGLLDLHVHDLRDWTHDRHRTVDDAPYGGGAGMVMRPEPWGEALDALCPEAPEAPEGTEGTEDTGGAGETVLVVPTPSGEPFTQAVAVELAGAARLVFACGRYEGIDQRVVDHARTKMPVRELSIGDYVLNGGEVAALAIIEAVVRLLPGFMGNPESLAEESHGENGLLEYPVYTKPPSWRGLDVPPVLRSGDHGAVARWRHEQALRRTALRRPDLLHLSAALSRHVLEAGAFAGLDDVELRPVRPGDLGELQTLQWACFEPALHEPLDILTEDVLSSTSYVLRAAGRLVGSVRCQLLEDQTVWQLGLLMVPPDLRGRGIGRFLLGFAEQQAPSTVTTFRLFTGAAKDRNLRMYKKAGYSVRGARPERPDILVLTKRRR